MKIFKEVLLVMMLFAFTTIIYHHLSYPKKLKNAIQREIALNFGVKSTIGTMKMNLFRGEVKIKDASLKSPHEDFESPFFIEFPGIYAKFSPFAFFFNEIILDEIVFYSPRVYLEYSDIQNKTNFDFTYNHVVEHIPSVKSKYFTIRDLEIRDLEILNMQDSLKAHSVGEIIVKNIGAQESGMGCARLSCTFLNILYDKALKYYIKLDKNYPANTISGKVSNKKVLVDSYEVDNKNDAGNDKIINEEHNINSVNLREVKDIIRESEKEIKELEGAIGVKPMKTSTNSSLNTINNKTGESLYKFPHTISGNDKSEDEDSSMQRYGKFFNLHSVTSEEM